MDLWNNKNSNVVIQIDLKERHIDHIMDKNSGEMITVKYWDCRESQMRKNENGYRIISEIVKKCIEKVIMQNDLDLIINICSDTNDLSIILNSIMMSLIKEGVELKCLYVAVGNNNCVSAYDLENNEIYSYVINNDQIDHRELFKTNKQSLMNFIIEMQQ